VQTVEALFSDLGKNIDDTKSFTFVRKYVECNRIVCLERFMDNRPPKGEKLMLSFGPMDFSAQINITRFSDFMLKKSVGLMTNEEIISKCRTPSRSYLLTK
jgi:hypothetical protein